MPLTPLTVGEADRIQLQGGAPNPLLCPMPWCCAPA